jgi:hypothetical protein
MADVHSGEFDNCTPSSNLSIVIGGLVLRTDVWDSEGFREDHIMADKEGLDTIKAIVAINCMMLMCADWK